MKILKTGTAQLLSAGDRAQAGFWRWTASFLVLCIAFFAISFVFFEAVPAFLGEEVGAFTSGDTLHSNRSDFLISTVFLFAFIAAFVPAIALSVRVLKLRLSSLVAPLDRVRWNLIAKTAFFTFCLVVVGTIVSLWTHAAPEDVHFDPIPPTLWYYVPIIIIAIALQASAEELLLRGYVLQMTGRIAKSWWAILIIVGGIFFALHLGNPEVEVFGWHAYLSYGLSAFLFTVLALTTGRLEYSIGAHIGWNWSVMVFDLDPLKVPDLYTGFGVIVYSGPLEPSLSDAITEILLHLIIGLWCLTTHVKQEIHRRV